MSTKSETEHKSQNTHVVGELTVVHDHVEICDAVRDRTWGKDLVTGRPPDVEIGTFRTGANGVGDGTCFGAILCKTSPVVAKGSDNVVLEGETGIVCFCMELYFCRN